VHFNFQASVAAKPKRLVADQQPQWRLSEHYLLMGQLGPPFEKSRVPSVINFCQLVMN
jgi:hypothetical protein